MAGQETYLKWLARERRLLRYAKFRAAYDQAARRCGQPAQDIGQRQFERWLEGRLTGLPRPAACEVLEEMFGHDAEQLFTRIPVISGPARDAAGPAGGFSGLQLAGRALAVAPLDTGEPGPGAAPAPDAAGGPAAEWELCAGPGVREHMLAVMAEESQDLGEWVAGTAVAGATIEQITAQVRRLAADYVHAAPFPLLVETSRLRDRITRQLHRHHRLDQARELYLLAAQTCGLLAWMTGDAGDCRGADKHAWTAWECAGQAGHDGARAWVRATQAKLAYWDGRYDESAQLAADGLGYKCPGTGRPFLALLLARSVARSGQRDDARSALHQAAQAWQQAAAPDLVGGLWSLTPGRYHALAASTYLLLADPPRALTAAGRAIELFRSAPAGQQNYGAWMHAHIDQVLAHLQEPDLDGATAALHPILSLPAASRYSTVIQHLNAARPLLARPAVAGAAGARDMLEAIGAYEVEARVAAPPIDA